MREEGLLADAASWPVRSPRGLELGGQSVWNTSLMKKRGERLNQNMKKRVSLQHPGNPSLLAGG